MKRKGLALPGYACTSQIWVSIRAQMDALYDVTWVDWPHERTTEFHSVSAFADWLQTAAGQVRYDFVIGHSMGGLVALELAQREKILRRKVILIETFLLPPSPFFQNLFVKPAPEEVVQPAIEMLQRGKEHYYSPRLQEALKQVDMCAFIADLGMQFHVLYGDRGCGDVDRVVEELAWPQLLQQWGNLAVIKNACHFPMIENAEMTVRVLQSILG